MPRRSRATRPAPIVSGMLQDLAAKRVQAMDAAMGDMQEVKKMMKDLNVCHTNPAYNPDYSGGEMDGGNEISGDVF